MVFQCINICQVPWEVLRTAAFGLGFQHLPRNLANVNVPNNQILLMLVKYAMSYTILDKKFFHFCIKTLRCGYLLGRNRTQRVLQQYTRDSAQTVHLHRLVCAFHVRYITLLLSNIFGDDTGWSLHLDLGLHGD